MGKKAKQKQGKKTNSNKKQNGQKVGNDDDEESPRGRGARRDRNGPGTRKNGMNRKERNGKGSTITIDDGNLRRMVEGGEWTSWRQEVWFPLANLLINLTVILHCHHGCRWE